MSSGRSGFLVIKKNRIYVTVESGVFYFPFMILSSALYEACILRKKGFRSALLLYNADDIVKSFVHVNVYIHCYADM